uniref:Monocarboxylate transporter 9 n=2 Tax=Latimeria chalumnae TaxID=7897 RepID=H2ZXI5_LATCH
MSFQRTPEALDGGWGWVIVFVSFLAQFLAYGSPFAVGVLYPEWLEMFGEGKGMTAWVGSLAGGVGLIASPVCSVCVSSFGARAVTIFSGFMVAGGLILSAFAADVNFLIFSYGIIVGLGCGLVYPATITITCQYFEKYRGLALGLISTGSSVGLFIYAALQKVLIEIYGLNGCLLIVGAVSLNLIVCGSLMRPLESPVCPSKERTNFGRISDQDLVCSEKRQINEQNVSMLKSSCTKDTTGCPAMPHDHDPDSSFNMKGPILLPAKTPQTCEKGSLSHTYFIMHFAKETWQAYLQYLEVSLELFKNKVFTALFVAVLLFDMGAFPPALLMEDMARSLSIDEEMHVIPLVSIMGITTAVGKFVLGVLADFQWVNSLYLYIITIITTGAALLVIPFVRSYAALAVLSAVLGFLSGNWAIFPYVTTKTVGMENLIHAYGILLFFAGIGNVLGPPIIGWFYDWTQTYEIAFYFSGVCVLLGGFLLLLTAKPCCNDIKKKSPKL